jgi:hypothetical protein
MRSVLLVVAGILIGFWFCRFLAEDSCLDAGGVWQDRPMRCLGLPAPKEKGG